MQLLYLDRCGQACQGVFRFTWIAGGGPRLPDWCSGYESKIEWLRHFKPNITNLFCFFIVLIISPMKL